MVLTAEPDVGCSGASAIFAFVGCISGLGRSPHRHSSNSLLTADTIQRGANHRGSALSCLHPRPDLPRGLVPDVLRVAAFEFGHPMPLQIFVKADDRSPHPSLGEIFARACLTTGASAASDPPAVH
jgi:hypothetical protein